MRCFNRYLDLDGFFFPRLGAEGFDEGWLPSYCGCKLLWQIQRDRMRDSKI